MNTASRLAAACVLLAPFAAHAKAPFLKVDVIASSSNGTPQDGWNTVNCSQGKNYGPIVKEYEVSDLKHTDGKVTATIAVNGFDDTKTEYTSRDRSVNGMSQYSGVFPYYDLYKDFISTGGKIYVRIAGLKRGVVYDFTAWMHDWSWDVKTNGEAMQGRLQAFDNGALVGTAESFYVPPATVFTADTDMYLYAKTVSAMADEDGAVTFCISSTIWKAVCLNAYTLAVSDSADDSITVDFGLKQGAVQDGAVAFALDGENADDKTVTYSGLTMDGTYGKVAVTLSLSDAQKDGGCRFIARDRATAAPAMPENGFAWFNAYRDIIGVTGEKAPLPLDMDVTIAGLLPEARYQLVLCPYDWSYDRTYVVTDWTSGKAGRSRTFTAARYYDFSAETEADVLTAKMPVVSDAEGKIAIKNSVTSGGATISWLRLTYDPVAPKGFAVIIR